MQFGVGLDGTLGLSVQDEMEMSRETARLGYTSIWTPEGTGQDSFQVCNYRWSASRDVVPEGLHTGISVSPVMWRSPMAFAMSGGTMSQVTGGRFYMGIGAGGVYQPRARQQTGMARVSALAMMRDYLTTVRGLVAGERVTYEGETVTLRGGRLGIRPAPNTRGLSRCPRPADAGARWRVRRRRQPQLVRRRARRLEPRARERRRRESGQGPL